MTKLSPPSVTLTVGEPDVAGPLAVFPLFGPPAALDVRLVRARRRARRRAARARRRRVRQRPAGRATRLDVPVLLYEGEEVLGAQQNRTFDVSVLVAAGAQRARAGELRRGRPLGRLAPRRAVRRRARRPHTRRCAARRTARRARGWRRPRGARRPGRGVGRGRRQVRPAWAPTPRPARCTTSTSAGATRLARAARDAIRLHDGQIGALVAIGGQFAVLDYVSRADVFARLARPARPGLRARRARARHGRAPPAPPSIADVRRLPRVRLSAAPAVARPAVGLGETLRFASPTASGARARATASSCADRVPGRAGEGADEPSVASVTLTPCGSPPASTTRCCSRAAHHGRKLRKGTGIPYLSHLLAVTALVLEAGGDQTEAIGALLHDAVEDGGGPEMLEYIRAQFGDEVAAIVEANSDSDEQPKPPWRERKEHYIAAIPNKSASAVLVSVADKLHNARAMLLDYRSVGEPGGPRRIARSLGPRGRRRLQRGVRRWAYPGAGRRRGRHVARCRRRDALCRTSACRARGVPHRQRPHLLTRRARRLAHNRTGLRAVCSDSRARCRMLPSSCCRRSAGIRSGASCATAQLPTCADTQTPPMRT